MSKDALLSVTVLVDDDALSKIRSVARRLEQAGLKIEDVQEDTGTITGSIPAQKLALLEKVEGVSAVEQQREVRIPPPDSDVQ